MNTTEPLTPPHGPGATEPPGNAPLRAAQLPTFGEMVDEIVPLIGLVFVAGPPVIFVAGPWLLLCLMLTGPFAVLVAFVAMWVVAAVVLATLARIFATPYQLLRGLHGRYRTSHAIAVPGVHVASLESGRVVA